MWTLGIDVAKRSHRATLLDEDGQAVCRNLAVEQSRQGVEQCGRHGPAVEIESRPAGGGGVEGGGEAVAGG